MDDQESEGDAGRHRRLRFCVQFEIVTPNSNSFLPVFCLPTQNPPIILLKDGTENQQGKQQVISNINACQSIAEAVRTTLGPRGMDKMIVDAKGDVTISNDGATILKKLDIVHPGAKTLVDIARSQDDEASAWRCSFVFLKVC